MISTTATRDDDAVRWADWHKLLCAEDGCSMLTTHAEQNGLDPETTRRLAAEVNRQNEPGNLPPRASISTVVTVNDHLRQQMPLPLGAVFWFTITLCRTEPTDFR
jgi:hypothetical protein